MMEVDGHPKYLKRKDAAFNNFHIWTPYLAERPDMEPFDPPVLQNKVVLTTKGGYKLQIANGPGRCRILAPTGEVAEKFICKADALAWLADRNEEPVEEKKDDSAGAIGEGQKAA
jgi:hypothetical protein